MSSGNRVPKSATGVMPPSSGHLHVDLCNRQVNGQFDHQHIAFKADLGHAEAKVGVALVSMPQGLAVWSQS